MLEFTCLFDFAENVYDKYDIWFHHQQLIKSFEVCDLPVRAAKFVARKNWLISGSVSAGFFFLSFIN